MKQMREVQVRMRKSGNLILLLALRLAVLGLRLVGCLLAALLVNLLEETKTGLLSLIDFLLDFLGSNAFFTCLSLNSKLPQFSKEVGDFVSLASL